MKKSSTISFGDPRNKRTGCFCHNSYYGFELGEKWQTVLHYALAKANPTIPSIKTASTIFQAKKLSERKASWKDIYEGTKAKFNQNPYLKSQLLATGDCKLVHTRSKYLGTILEYLRETYKPTLTLFKLAPVDLFYPKLTTNQSQTIQNLVIFTQRIMKGEGCCKVYYEMVCDALVNLMKRKEVNQILEVCEAFVKKREGVLYTKFPNFLAIYNTLIEKYAKVFHPKDSKRCVVLAMSFIIWLDAVVVERKVYILQKLSNPGKIPFQIPTGHRKYRKDVYKYLNLEDQDTELMMPRRGMFGIVKETSTKLYVGGKDMNKHAEKLLDMGGKYNRENGEIDVNVIVFDAKEKKKVEEYVSVVTKKKHTKEIVPEPVLDLGSVSPKQDTILEPKPVSIQEGFDKESVPKTMPPPQKIPNLLNETLKPSQNPAPETPNPSLETLNPPLETSNPSSTPETLDQTPRTQKRPPRKSRR